MRNNLGAVTTVDYAAVDHVLPARPGRRHALGHAGCRSPCTASRRSPSPICAGTRSSPRRTAITTATSTASSASSAGSAGSSRWIPSASTKFSAANSGSPFVAADHKLYQPPVKTITWFHTGIAADRSRILGLYEREYFPVRWTDRLPAGPGAFAEHILAQPEIEAAAPGLQADEWREAMRACKGMVLRQEVFELDVRALEDDRRAQADTPVLGRPAQLSHPPRPAARAQSARRLPRHARARLSPITTSWRSAGPSP